MNSQECARVQRLILELDDTRLLYAKLEPLLIRSHLRFLIAQLMRSHSVAAEELVIRMRRFGGLTADRGGGRTAWFRATLASWLAMIDLDGERACVRRIARRGRHVALLLRKTVNEVQALQQVTNSEPHQLERVMLRLEGIVHQLEPLPLSAAQVRAYSARLEPPERSQPRAATPTNDLPLLPTGEAHGVEARTRMRRGMTRNASRPTAATPHSLVRGRAASGRPGTTSAEQEVRRQGSAAMSARKSAQDALTSESGPFDPKPLRAFPWTNRLEDHPSRPDRSTRSTS